jgi:hypothetical protein
MLALLLLMRVGAVTDGSDANWLDESATSSAYFYAPPRASIADSRPDITCTATLIGDRDELTGEFSCVLLLARNESIASDVAAGRIAVSSLFYTYVPDRELIFFVDESSTEMTDDRRRLRLFASGFIALAGDDLTFDLHERRPLGPGMEAPGWPIEWTVRTRALDLRGVDGKVDLLSWKTDHVRFQTRTNSDATLVVGANQETNFQAIGSSGGSIDAPTDLRHWRIDDPSLVLLLAIGPFVLFTLLVGRRHDFLYRRVRPFALTYLGGVVAIGTVLGGSVIYGADTSVFVEGWLWLNLGAVLIAVLRHASGRPPFPRSGLGVYAVVACVLLGVGFAILGGDPTMPMAHLVPATALGGVLAALATAVAGGRQWWYAAAVIGAGSAAAAMVPRVLGWVSVRWGSGVPDLNLLIRLAVGIPLFLLTRHVTRTFFPAGFRLAGLLPWIALMSLLSIPMLIDDPKTQASSFSGPVGLAVGTVEVWATVGGFLLLLLLFAAMRDEAVRTVPYRDSSALVVLSTGSAIVVASVDSAGYGPHLIVAQALLPLLYGLLLRHRLSGRADALGAVTPRVHARLMRMEIRRRHLARALTSLLHAAGKTGDGEQGDVPAMLRSISELEDSESPPRWARTDYVTVALAALGNSGGTTRTANARAAAVQGFLLSLPIALFGIVEAVRSGEPLHEYTTIDHLWILAVLFKGVIYGALGGYYYPLLPGGSPVAKFGALLAVVVTVETVVFARTFDDSTDALQNGLIRLGILVFFFLAMGLLWERRLTVLAGVPWQRLRDFRSVRALVTPVTTVLVAGATVLITTLTTAAIGPGLQPPTGEEPEPKPSTEQTVPPTDR